MSIRRSTVTSQSDEPEASAPVAEKSSSEGLTGRELWDSVRIEPVEIALPGGVGLTLRAYRKAGEVTPTELEAEEEDIFDAHKRVREEDGEEFVEVSDEELERQALDAGGETSPADASDDAEEKEEVKTEPEETSSQADDEEVPLFLSHKGRLLAFKSAESLVSFLRSGAPHDLAQLDTWEALAERVQSSDIDPQPEDRYELDLVVENLRGGHDSWDLPLLIAAGEIARDLGHALRIKPVILALSPGSPLDDLDESLRSAENGGVSGFFGRRRLKKIGAQQASLGWRSVIGKISAAVDWRD
ncbi:DNA primase [Actinoplanes sp. NPDC023714]|uniref:DNA primase n=1 Tax=Actinoplanes sp. NPDC023714 TaxID=3154322 RepID=UPI003404785B